MNIYTNLKKWLVFSKIFAMVSEQLPPEENCPPVKVGVWVKVRVSFRVGGQPDNCPQGKLAPG